VDVTIRLQEQAFDPGAETNAFRRGTTGSGAMVTFTGLVRSTAEAPIETLTLEHYPELAEAQLTDIATRAAGRFGLSAVSVIHRYGTMRPDEVIVQVMTLAPHRRAAFEGAEYVMDYLKTDAPFWKKETTPEGSRWIGATSADDKARNRWTIE